MIYLLTLEQFQENNIKTSREMLDYIISNNMKDSFGIIDTESAKQIAYMSEFWTLKYISLDNFDIFCDPNFKNKSTKTNPIIVKLYDNTYDVLDGKHRIGMAKSKGDINMLMWVGDFS